MPMPKPKKYERKEKFISRCIETLTTEEEERFPKKEQRAAICYSQWNRRHKDK